MTAILRLCAVIVGMAILMLCLFMAATFSGTVLWFIWGELGPTYFSFAPKVLLDIGWWHTVLMVWMFSIVANILFKSGTPKT
ncbi:hypothetical protein D3C87_278720 [compost metagenome]